MITIKKSFQNKYNNLDEKKVTDNKTFWKTIKPFLSNKIVSREKVTLREEDDIIESDITQVLIQDFVREGGSLAPKIYRGVQRRENSWGSSRRVWRHAPPEKF